MTLNDPELVREEYATEAGLMGRRAAYRWADGPDAPALLLQTVVDLRPGSVLEVGCGPGELSERIRIALGAAVAAIDISPRMVELARARGVGARVGDVQELPFPDAVEEHDAGGTIRFPDRESVVSYIRSSITLMGDTETRLPEFEPPYVVRRHPTIFVARKA